MQIKRTESSTIPDSVPKSCLIKLFKIWGSVHYSVKSILISLTSQSVSIFSIASDLIALAN